MASTTVARPPDRTTDSDPDLLQQHQQHAVAHMKHIEVRYLFMRERVLSDEVKLQYLHRSAGFRHLHQGARIGQGATFFGDAWATTSRRATFEGENRNRGSN